MADQYNLTLEQRNILIEKANRRAVLRAEFQKLASNPHRHATQEGGTVFDPALQRFIAMKVSSYEHFKPNARNAGIGLALFIVPVFAYAYAINSNRTKKEDAIRQGLVAYRDRPFKFA